MGFEHQASCKVAPANAHVDRGKQVHILGAIRRRDRRCGQFSHLLEWERPGGRREKYQAGGRIGLCPRIILTLRDAEGLLLNEPAIGKAAPSVERKAEEVE